MDTVGRSPASSPRPLATTSCPRGSRFEFLAGPPGSDLVLMLWDDSNASGSGLKFKFWMTYFMASEEATITEMRQGSEKIANAVTLLKRSRLPRFVLGHDDRMRSVEDVTGDEDYYHEDDLIVG